MIPVFKPSHDHREIIAVAETLRSGWTGLGPRVTEFERQFASYVGVKYAVATNSGTAALHLAYRLANTGPADEVIVPSLTFVSTALAASYLGATPIFADSCADTLLMDYDHARTLITPRTKAVCLVLYGGQTVSSIPQFYCDRNIPVIFDCAHACGSKQDLSIAPLHCWSFHAVKNLACGDGGMVTMHSEDLYERARRLRWCGIDTSTYDRGVSPTGTYKWEYDVKEVGYKSHMNDITASIGLEQLKKLPDMQLKRSKIAERYISHNLPVQIQPILNSSLHLLSIRCDRRNDLADHLRGKGINTGVHYKPIHLYDCWGKQRPFLPIVEREWQRLLTLPLYPDLELEKVDYICDSIKEFYANNHPAQ